MVLRLIAMSNERQSPFKSAMSYVPLEGSIKRILSMRTPPEGLDHEETSPFPHKEG